MRVVLLGAGHLARVRRDLGLIGPDVHNGAVGGATVRALAAQATGAQVARDDVVVVSIGSNDAAPWKQVPVADFRGTLDRLVTSVPVAHWVLVTPPGVDESRLTGERDRTNQVVAAYREAAVGVLAGVGAGVLRAEQLLRPLGADAFVGDGLHLTGRAYALLLPAIRATVEAVSGERRTEAKIRASRRIPLRHLHSTAPVACRSCWP